MVLPTHVERMVGRKDKAMKPKNYFFITDDFLNDPNVRLTRPKYNADLCVNVSGMTFKQLAYCLWCLAQMIDEATETDGMIDYPHDMPYMDVRLNYKDKFPWEDGYEDCGGMSGVNLILTKCSSEDGSCSIRMSPDIYQATKEGRTITEMLRRVAHVTDTGHGQKIEWEYRKD